MTAAQRLSQVFGWTFIVVGVAGCAATGMSMDPNVETAPRLLGMFPVNVVHNIVHLLTGAAALFVAFGLNAEQRPMGLIGLGVAYAGVVLLTLVSPNLFGILGDQRYNVNVADHALHLAIAAASIAVGWWARTPERGRA